MPAHPAPGEAARSSLSRQQATPVGWRANALVLGVALLLAGPAQAAQISGVGFDDRTRLASTDLQLNGLGLRAVAWLKGYAAGLYLAQAAHTPAEVLALPGPKRIQLKMMVDVDAKEFSKAFRKGIRRNTSEADQAALGDRINAFDRRIDEIGAVRKGDVVNLDYLPGRGVLLSLNGLQRGQAIAGEDLYAGILKIFIGERPVDKDLKAGLLGAGMR